jgi:hypothetical protein
VKAARRAAGPEPIRGVKGDAMPSRHLLWRLCEGKTSALQVRVTSARQRPGCALLQVGLFLRLEPASPKPAGAKCLLCQRDLGIMAAAPIKATNSYERVHQKGER